MRSQTSTPANHTDHALDQAHDSMSTLLSYFLPYPSHLDNLRLMKQSSADLTLVLNRMARTN
jgi:hypothetical protein